jgi:uncharacterized protein (TIGR03086 family)
MSTSTVATDQTAMLGRALDGAGTLIAGVRPEQLAGSTPCADWDVQTLVSHMIGVNHGFVAGLAGQSVGGPGLKADDTLVGADLGAAFVASAGAALDAWRRPGSLEQSLLLEDDLSIPARVGINFQIMEQILHSWDLATAIGTPWTMDSDLATVALDVLQQVRQPALGVPGEPFAEEIPWRSDAPVQERLLAFSGRRPSPKA